MRPNASFVQPARRSWAAVPWQRTDGDWPLVLFVCSAVLGLLAAYDSGSAWPKFGLILAGLTLHQFLCRIPSHLWFRGTPVPVLRIIVGLTPAAVAGYFILTNDWRHPVEKTAWLEPVRGWLAARQLDTPLLPIHPNVAGGVLAMWLPLQIAAARPSRAAPRPARAEVVLSTIAVGLSGTAILLSSLRGAWLALAAAVTVWAWGRLIGLVARRRGWAVAAALWAGLACALTLAWLVWGQLWWIARPDRLLVWRNSWQMAHDYFFTGGGLGSFTMAYSSYALLIHVPHTAHAHNLFLDVWLGQGLLGLGALIWLMASGWTPRFSARPSGAHQRAEASRWRSAAGVALGVVVLHGLIDDVYYGYGGAGILALFVPMALATRTRSGAAPVGVRPRRSIRSLMAAIPVCVFTVAFMSSAVRAQFRANLGALRQTRVELAVYEWPKWPLQDAVRRAHEIDLAPALADFSAALELDPTNVTANRRLGQIELSFARYQGARTHLAAAFTAAPWQTATRQLYGESLAATGDVPQAAQLWRSIPLDQDQLQLRQAWHEMSDQETAKRIASARALMRVAAGSE